MQTRQSPSQANLAQSLNDLLPFVRSWADARGLTTRAERITGPAGGRITMATIEPDADTLTVILAQDMKTQDLIPRLKAARTFADLVVMAALDAPTAHTAKQCKALGTGIITPTTKPGAYYLGPTRCGAVQTGQREALWHKVAAIANGLRSADRATQAELIEQIHAYMAAHPRATVAEIWQAIPNDYINPRSFENNLRAHLTAARNTYRPHAHEARA